MKYLPFILFIVLLISCHDEDVPPAAPDEEQTIEEYVWSSNPSFNPGDDYSPNIITSIGDVTFIGGVYNARSNEFYLVDSTSLYKSVQSVCYSVPLEFTLGYDYTQVKAVSGVSEYNYWIAAQGTIGDGYDFCVDYGIIYHYNGTTTTKHDEYFCKGVVDILALAENNLLVLGLRTIFKYDGSKWEVKNLEERINLLSVSESGDKILIMGKEDGNYNVYEYTNDTLGVAIQTTDIGSPAFGAPYFTKVNRLGTLSYGNGAVSLWNRTSHTNILIGLNNVTYIGGRDVNNILIINNEEELYHYNGTLLTPIDEVNEMGLRLTQAYANGEEFFVLCYDNGYKLLYGVKE